MLNELSMHLSTFYRSFEKKRLRTLERTDLPDVLFRNHVLDLVSRDMQDRPGFEARDYGSRAVAVFGDLYYSRFSLTLPKGSVVRRTSDALVIENSAVKIAIQVESSGVSAFLPFKYLTDAIGVSPLDACVDAVNICIQQGSSGDC